MATDRKYSPFIVKDGGQHGDNTPHQVYLERNMFDLRFISTTANKKDALRVAEALKNAGANCVHLTTLTEGAIT